MVRRELQSFNKNVLMADMVAWQRRTEAKKIGEYMTSAARSRMWAMRAVRKAIRANVLIRMPCERCGISGNEVMSNGQSRSIVQAHHDDYNFPLQVRWLCNSHHHQWHAFCEPIMMAAELIGKPPLELYHLGLRQMNIPTPPRRLVSHRKRKKEKKDE